MRKTLRLLLGDQLNAQHAWFETPEKNVLYLMMEIRQETDYVRHHIQKVLAFFLAMRTFAEERQAEGHQFVYLRIDDSENRQQLTENIRWAIEQYGIECFEYQLPDEYRLDEQLKTFTQGLSILSRPVDSQHFLVRREYVGEFFRKKKTYLLESFYRQMRREFDILMQGTEPEGGKWNYDTQNRKKFDGKVSIPPPLYFQRDVSELAQTLQKVGVRTIGNLKPEQFNWAVTRAEGLKLLDYFTQKLLPYFGTYQDAMEPDEPYLFHSRLSFLMNVKLLSPLEVVEHSVKAWQARKDEISLAQIEGFVRQIIGWREYMRGIYWAEMPDYATKNYFGHTRKLPDFFWSGETKMRCVREAVKGSLDHAYAHHIQRLMVTGNFALLAGIAPDEVDAWYLGIYADAIEWVEITNTRGMSQFADGGIVGTKPYVSSANYMQKMSRYCKGCHYSHKLRHGERACPFNSLYWHFFERHRELLEKNPRIGMAYRNLDRMEQSTREKLLQQAEDYLSRIEEL